MQEYVALLRGINVSGQKKIPMKDLRESLESSGLANIETYIQSGNVLFDVKDEDERDLTAVIQKSILDNFGFEVPTLVLPQVTFGNIIEYNPFLEDGVDTKRLYVSFLFNCVDDESQKELAKFPIGEDRYEIVRSFIYLKYSESISKSKLDNGLIERKLGVTATMRNWNTILKLAGKS